MTEDLTVQLSRDWRDWIPEAGLAVLVAAAGLVELSATNWAGGSELVLLALALVLTAVSVLLSRKLPGAALTLVWGLCVVQVASGTRLLLVQVAFAAVAFGTARWGSRAVLLAGLASIPAAAVAGIVLVTSFGYYPLPALAGLGAGPVLFDAANRVGATWTVVAGLLVTTVLGLPWLAGLALRFADRARVSRSSQLVAEQETARAIRESQQAREIGRLREEQARLARDVHDVVGHSLAVILAQAESAQFVPDTDVPKLKQTMQNIATSARASLQDVRQVLDPAGQGPPGEQPGGLDSLIEGVRASGHQVVSRELGTAQPMPPELGVVAYRVLQEMLTNAIRHGRRDQPVVVERFWPDGTMAHELRIEVRNVVASGQDGGGRGLEGMRRRLESAGGRLDVRRREEATGPTFTATAWVPVRPVAAA